MATEQRIEIHDQDLRQFEEGLDGILLQPGDEGYDEARVIHNAAYQRSPLLILRAASARDVIRGVAFARNRELEVAVRSGGHSVAGHSSSDVMVIDLSPMRYLEIDPERHIVRAGPGLTWGEVSVELHEYGLAVPSGDTGSVGVGGLTVGGGIGWLVRKYGLTIDSLQSVDIVTADGQLRRASAEENPDLFWAVRGGGGNFGIVTSFEFRAHPVGTIIGGAIIYDASESRTVLPAWARYAQSAPEELSTIVFVLHAPPLPFIPPEVHGRNVIVIGVCCVGDPETGQGVVAPLRELGTVLADITGPAPYPAVYALTESVAVPGFHSEIRSSYLRELEGDALETILRGVDTLPAPMGLVQLRALGGAMERVPADATAFAHRDRSILAAAIGLWEDPTEAASQRAWVEEFGRDLRPHADGVYVNFLSDEGPERVAEAYGQETYRRLSQLKRTYDPANVFRLNQNIQPG